MSTILGSEKPGAVGAGWLGQVASKAPCSFSVLGFWFPSGFCTFFHVYLPPLKILSPDSGRFRIESNYPKWRLQSWGSFRDASFTKRTQMLESVSDTRVSRSSNIKLSVTRGGGRRGP